MIESHKHCPVCNTPIPMEELTCSPTCQETLVAKQKKVKKSRMTLMILIILFLVVVAYMSFFR